MNAVRWQCNLQPSRSARWLNLALTLLCVLLLVSAPWPDVWRWGRAPLILLLLLSGWRHERRLGQRTGRLALDEKGNWHWRGRRWRPQHQACWLPWGVLLVLRPPQGRCWRLWLMQDSMPPQAWRALRARCVMQQNAP